MSSARTTRWLDAQEQQVWAQLSTMILRLQPVLSAPLQREFGISQFEYLMLARLSEAPASMLRMSVLATHHRQLAAAVVPGSRSPRKTRLGITAARRARQSLYGCGSDPRRTSPTPRSRSLARRRSARVRFRPLDAGAGPAAGRDFPAHSRRTTPGRQLAQHHTILSPPPLAAFCHAMPTPFVSAGQSAAQPVAEMVWVVRPPSPSGGDHLTARNRGSGIPLVGARRSLKH